MLIKAELLPILTSWNLGLKGQSNSHTHTTHTCIHTPISRAAIHYDNTKPWYCLKQTLLSMLQKQLEVFKQKSKRYQIEVGSFKSTIYRDESGKKIGKGRPGRLLVMS